MRKEKEQTINGIKFKVTQLGFADGMELFDAGAYHFLGAAISDLKKRSSFASHDR